MEFIRFLHRPGNELEKGGRRTAQSGAESGGRACPGCRAMIEPEALRENMYCCASCGRHFRISARRRIELLTDKGSFKEHFAGVKSLDVLSFPGYGEKLGAAEAASGEAEGVICGEARVDGLSCCIFAMEPRFMMGSMGSAVGEKLCRIFEYAAERRLPVVGYTVSGGARMQEGINSLMQMAKTSGAVLRHSEQGLLYIAVLTDPTTGGVTASFAMEGDIIIAEPGATIGFAGARVIEQTTRRRLPQGFQKAEFLLEHGFVDAIVPRSGQREAIARLLRLHGGEGNA